ncbi:uncharacterized protein [Antedon mediterranea]|uniref:uncharacterized protein n=1 Tax=Antedon mediterranea TaxID=105859 RepID=UPI003AF94A10
MDLLKKLSCFICVLIIVYNTESSLVRTLHEHNCFLSNMMVRNKKDYNVKMDRVVNSCSAIQCVSFCTLDPTCVSIRFDRINSCVMYSSVESGSLDTDNGQPTYYEISKIKNHESIGYNENDEVKCFYQYGYECQNMICKEYVTTANYEYRFDNPILQVETTTRIEFSVVAKNDVHIALSSSPEVMIPMYEIVIGGWENTQSVIRRCAQCPDKKIYFEAGIISVDEFTKFWISFVNGSIRVGLEGSDHFMEWDDPYPFPVKYVGFSTWYNIKGIFQFCH